MTKVRLEAFTDGVFAIIITIMVLELKIPTGNDLDALKPQLPVFLSYILSFVNVGIYWVNHHHLFAAVDKVSGRVLWMNCHLLFWLSLFPTITAWMGEHHFSLWPVVLYGFVSMMAGMAYYILVRSLMRIHQRNSALVEAIGNDWKGKISVVIYILGIGLCFIHPLIGMGAYSLVAGMWIIPDRRFEKRLETKAVTESGKE